MATPFDAVPSQLDFPKYERNVLKLWRERGILAKTLATWGQAGRKFVFYEGPPTANGLPHNGHVLTRVIKDLFPRYHTMLGERVLRKGGWDTHGLPVEVEVEKELRLHGKAAIEEYGVEPFVDRCIESVFRYTSEWERLTERIGFWVSLDNAYVTYHKSYVESVWWALSELFRKGLLYQGHKVVWWWAQGGTALSSAEVGLGYKSVDDPSVYVAFPLLDRPDTALVTWTTTPWTLPSNCYAAVKSGCEYDVVSIGDPIAKPGSKEKPRGMLNLSVSNLIVASALRASLEEKLGHQLVVIETHKGESLVGLRYEPPFSFYSSSLKGVQVALKGQGVDALWWRVIAEEFVTLESGTGIVHIAPAFGEDDHQAHRRQLTRYAEPEKVELLCAILPDGTFKPEFGKYAGRWIKDCDRELIGELSHNRRLVHDEVYRHDYPFCWRADSDPLIQFARPAWFIRTTAKLDRALGNNQLVNWLPEHIKEGRFGDFLRNNVDWALSRERYWGTPLNVWVCSHDPEHKHAPSSVEEIERLNPRAFDHFRQAQRERPELNPHLIVHKPWVDQVVFPCPVCGAEMQRVSEVIDCWFDSGCMPFAQWGYPHVVGSKTQFEQSFPADFISEAIDQTRGWFYSLLMVSSLVFDEETQKRWDIQTSLEYPHPYRSCIVLGHVCDREGKKESKSRGNYTPPELILDRVRIEFGVLGSVADACPPPGEAWIGREDLEGMDLEDGAEVAIYRASEENKRLKVRLRVHKKLPRRLVVLSEQERVVLAVEQAVNGLTTMPVEVPRLPAKQRVWVEDELTPAPGADAFRWFFYASSPPSSNTRHSLKNVRTLQKEFLIKIRNVYSFFTIYANIDGYNPIDVAQAGQPREKRSLLDRWMLSELNIAVRSVRKMLDEYRVYDAAVVLIELVEGISNWYVRRSRARFWGAGLDQDKRDAYATLHETLVCLSLLIAPFVPFLSEEIYQNLVVRAGLSGASESVHLAEFPKVEVAAIDEKLAEETAAVREVVSLGLSVRTASKLRVRQPLSRVDLVFNSAELAARLSNYTVLIQEELNVHEVQFLHSSQAQTHVSFRVKPNFRSLGPKLGKHVQAVKKALESADGGALYAELNSSGAIRLPLGSEVCTLSLEDIEISVEAQPGYAAETGRIGVVVLHTTLTPELLDEGLFREILSRIQGERKEQGLDFAERIELWIDGSERVLRVAQTGEAEVRSECLATQIHWGDRTAAGREQELGDEKLWLALARV